MNFLSTASLSASAFPEMPGVLRWSADDIADAMPRRLSELYVFAPIAGDAHGDRPSRARRGYLPASAGPAMFRVRG